MKRTIYFFLELREKGRHREKDRIEQSDRKHRVIKEDQGRKGITRTRTGKDGIPRKERTREKW
jgi:hypothetical protein